LDASIPLSRIMSPIRGCSEPGDDASVENWNPVAPGR
jgi:hypothetical protein